MSNTYFRFKQFKIEQDQCAMKVSTDACIQGAVAQVPAGVAAVLDLGAGTGLLSLMLAQRFPDVNITAIELDTAAFRQAQDNINDAPYRDRITVANEDARTFDPGIMYPFLICNPPFFSNSLKGPADARNQARHDDTLSQEDLLRLMDRVLTPDGTACFLWPAAEQLNWERLLARSGYYLHYRLQVRDRAHTRITRIISICSRIPVANPVEEELIIKDENGTYTALFSDLLSPFYLHL